MLELAAPKDNTSKLLPPAITEPEKLNFRNQQPTSTEPKNSRVALYLTDINFDEIKQLRTPASAAPPQAVSGGEATNWKHLLAAGLAPILL